jgi:hypothetical protein
VSGPADKNDEGAGKRRPRPRGSQTTRDGLPRRLGEVLTPTLDRLATGDEARAYAAWARAVGDPVTGGTRPKAFRRGQLTIECASSVWANELTYLGPQILRRMDEVAPGHPVRRFRFVLGRLPAPAPAGEEPAPSAARSGAGETSGAEASGASSGQGSGGPTAKEKRRQQRPAPTAQDAARAQAERVGDERLRAAIEAALRPSSEESREASADGTHSG